MAWTRSLSSLSIEPSLLVSRSSKCFTFSSNLHTCIEQKRIVHQHYRYQNHMYESKYNITHKVIQTHTHHLQCITISDSSRPHIHTHSHPHPHTPLVLPDGPHLLQSEFPQFRVPLCESDGRVGGVILEGSQQLLQVSVLESQLSKLVLRGDTVEVSNDLWHF